MTLREFRALLEALPAEAAEYPVDINDEYAPVAVGIEEDATVGKYVRVEVTTMAAGR